MLPSFLSGITARISLCASTVKGRVIALRSLGSTALFFTMSDPLASPLPDEDPLAPPEELQGIELQGMERGVEQHPEANETTAKTDEPNDVPDDRLYLWLSLLVGIVGVAIIVTVIVVFGGDDSSAEEKPLEDGPAVVFPTFSPVASIADPQMQLNIIRQAVGANPATAYLMETLPETAGQLEGRQEDTFAEAAVRAASWVLFEDDYNAENQIIERFALATIYYGTGGDDWVLDTNWFTDTSYCDGWHGITCCGEFFEGTNFRCNGKHPEHIAEVNFHENNLEGTIPPAFALLTDVHTIALSWNALRGPLDVEVFGTLPELRDLYIQHNQLTGQLSPNMLDNNLEVFLTQSNLFTGVWPTEFCSTCDDNGCYDPLYSYGLDCTRLACPVNCCSLNANNEQICFDHEHVEDDEDLQ